MTDYLSLLNTLDENERLEAKRGSEIGPSILETICAFANEPGLQGGTLLLESSVMNPTCFRLTSSKALRNPTH